MGGRRPDPNPYPNPNLNHDPNRDSQVSREQVMDVARRLGACAVVITSARDGTGMDLLHDVTFAVAAMCNTGQPKPDWLDLAPGE